MSDTKTTAKNKILDELNSTKQGLNKKEKARTKARERGGQGHSYLRIPGSERSG